MKLYVQYNEECLHSESSAEPYGDWSSSWRFKVEGASLTSHDRYDEEKFEVGFEIEAGEPVFVLYMVYDTGDTFGRATGKGEVLWAFKDAKTATEALARWREENDKRDPDYYVTFEDETGRVVQLSNPAAGYFENLGYIELVTVLVNP